MNSPTLGGGFINRGGEDAEEGKKMRAKKHRAFRLLLRADHAGGLTSRALAKISKETDYKISSLKDIWVDRFKLMREMCQVDQTREVMLGILTEWKVARQELWRLYEDAREADNFTVCVGCLGRVMHSLDRETDVRQSLGILPKTPDELRIEQIKSYRAVHAVIVKAVEKENPKLLKPLYKVFKKLEKDL